MEASRAWFLKLAAAVRRFTFVTNQRRPILTLIEDTVGLRARHAHRALRCRSATGLLGVEGYHDNCRDNLHARPRRARDHHPGHAAVAQRVHEHPVDGGRAARVGRADVGAGKLRGVPRRRWTPVVAFSACPQDILPINGRTGRATEAPFRIE